MLVICSNKQQDDTFGRIVEDSLLCCCRLESSKTLLAEARSIEDLVTSHEHQLSQLTHLSADIAVCRQTREQLQVWFVCDNQCVYAVAVLNVCVQFWTFFLTFHAY